MRMTFAARSISGILTVAGLLVSVGMMSILALVWSTTTDLQHAMRESGQLTSAMRNHLQSDKAHNALRTTALQAYQASLTNDPAEAEAARRDMEKYLDQLRAVQERTVDLKLDGETATELRAVQQSYIDYIGSVMEIVALSGGNPEPVGQRMPQFQQTFAKMSRENARVTDLLETKALASGQRVSEALSSLLLQIALGVVGVFLLTAALVWQLHRRIVDPLTRISHDLKSDSPTDLTLDQARTDEIGELARSVGAFREANERARMSDGARVEAELRAQREAERLQSLADTAAALEQRALDIAENVLTTASQLKQVADSLADSAGKSSQETASATAAADETLGGVLGIAEATDQLLVSINDVATQIREVAQSGAEARALASSTGSTIVELNDMARRIASFTDLIAQIAQRSNLLALNASIEAAHAGSAGSGFAVVAEEVRQLSAQTANAVAEIEGEIRGIVSITSNATASLVSMSDAINSLGGATASIAAAAEQQSLATSEIGRTIEQSSNGTQNLRRNLQRVEGQVRETAASADTVRQATLALDAQAAELTREMETLISRARAA